MPWFYTDLQKKITDAVDVPILTGEDIYLKEEFAKLRDTHSVDMIHPDLATSGGLRSKPIKLAVGSVRKGRLGVLGSQDWQTGTVNSGPTAFAP